MGQKNKIANMDDCLRTITYMRLKELKSKYTICEWLVNQYSISKVRAYELIKTMENNIAEIYEHDNKKTLEKAIAKLEAIQEAAMDAGKVKEALACEIELNKIKGLYTIKIETSDKKEVMLFPDINYDENGEIIE